MRGAYRSKAHDDESNRLEVNVYVVVVLLEGDIIGCTKEEEHPKS